MPFRAWSLVSRLGCFLVVLIACACSREAADPAGHPDTAGPASPAPLVVGTEAAFPPFESVSDDGSLVGLDIELMRAVGAELGRPVTFRNLEFTALLEELRLGRVDAVCSGLSYTPERAEQVAFTRPYVRMGMGILLSTERASGVATLSDLDREGVVIAVQRKTTGAETAAERFPNAAIRAYDRELDAALEVASGRADALVYDMVSVLKLHRVHPEKTRILDAPLGTEHYCIAFAKGSPIEHQVSEFLDRETAPGGQVHALIEKWLGDPARFVPKSAR